MYNKRCPKCTLLPPCKHYESSDNLVKDSLKFLESDNFKDHLSPTKRKIIE